MTSNVTPINLEAVLTLQQTGLRGPMLSNVDYVGHVDGDMPLPASWLAMKNIEEELNKALALFSSPAPTDDTRNYKLVFKMTQASPDADVYASLSLDPKVDSNVPQEQPLAYQIGCNLMLMWMHQLGALADDGMIADDEIFSRIDIDARAPTRH